MAGGEGAKERRRLKRLAAKEAKDKSGANSLQKATTREKYDNRNDTRKSNHADPKRRKPDIGKGKQWLKKDGHHRKTKFSSQNIKKEKKPKIKKPKHLKRKLEQASNENEEAKEVILKEIEEFETKKTLYSKRNKRTKRQKTMNFDNSSNNGKDDVVVSRLNEINQTHSPFKRSEKLETTIPAVIESETIGGVEQRQSTKSMDLIRENIQIIPNTDLEEDSAPNDSNDCGSNDESTDEDESADEDESEKKFVKKIDHNNQSSPVNEASSHDTSSKTDDSDDDSDDENPVQKRQRGRRRRGRQDTAKKIEEMKTAEKSKATTSNYQSKRDESNSQDGKKRYCLGRKPVTDFVIGQSYPAKVVYVKPFGVFFDIGCHSDAFCHVSRLSDDFVKSPELKFKEGESVPKVRIVEIDRKQKRITVSLQSDARIDDERQSIEDRKSRKEKRKKKSKITSSSNSFIGKYAENGSESNSRNFIASKDAASHGAVHKASNNSPDPSTMTPAELKRARKLARRAERRAQAQQEA